MYEDNPNHILKHLDLLIRAIREEKWDQVKGFLQDERLDLSQKRFILRSRYLKDKTFFGAHAPPFHWACMSRESDEDTLKMMVEVGGTDMLASRDTVYKSNCLIWAVTNRVSLAVVQQIVSLNENLIADTNIFGNNAVHMACRFNCDFEVIKLLHEKGGQETANSKNNFGEIPFHHACRYHYNLKVVKYMVSRRRNILKKRDNKGKTCLAHAFKGDGSRDLINFLFDEFGEHDGAALLHTNTGAMLSWTNAQPNDVKTEFLSKPFLRRVLNSYFIHPLYLGILMCDFYTQLILVWIYSFGIGASIIQGDEALDRVRYVLLVACFLWRTCRELLKILSTPLNLYVTEPRFLMDVTLLALVLRSTISLTQTSELTNSEGVWICITTGFVWIHLILVLARLRYAVAIFVRAVKEIVVKLVPFYLTTMLVVFSFGNMFYIATLVEKRECPIPDSGAGLQEGFTCNTWDSYFTTFTMLLSTDWIYFNEPSLSLSTILAMLFATIIGILLLNILIAEIGVVWGDITEVGRVAFWSNRLSYIVEISLCFSDLFRLKSREIAGSFKGKHNADAVTPQRKHFDTLSTWEYIDMENNENMSEEDRHFFLWYKRVNDFQNPGFLSRMRVFFRRATLSEILIPGKSFEKVLSSNRPFSRIILFCFYPIVPIAIFIIFLLGLLSFGHFWPNMMKQSLFDGPVDVEDTEGNITELREEIKDMRAKLDRIHNSIMDRQEEYST